MAKKIIKNKAIFWDYDLDEINLNNPKIKDWYLSRKLEFGDLDNISKTDLKIFLPQLKINNSLKELLRNFLNQYA